MSGIGVSVYEQFVVNADRRARVGCRWCSTGQFTLLGGGVVGMGIGLQVMVTVNLTEAGQSSGVSYSIGFEHSIWTPPASTFMPGWARGTMDVDINTGETTIGIPTPVGVGAGVILAVRFSGSCTVCTEGISSFTRLGERWMGVLDCWRRVEGRLTAAVRSLGSVRNRSTLRLDLGETTVVLP